METSYCDTTVNNIYYPSEICISSSDTLNIGYWRCKLSKYFIPEDHNYSGYYCWKACSCNNDIGCLCRDFCLDASDDEGCFCDCCSICTTKVCWSGTVCVGSKELTMVPGVTNLQVCYMDVQDNNCNEAICWSNWVNLYDPSTGCCDTTVSTECPHSDIVGAYNESLSAVCYNDEKVFCNDNLLNACYCCVMCLCDPRATLTVCTCAVASYMWPELFTSDVYIISTVDAVTICNNWWYPICVCILSYYGDDMTTSIAIGCPTRTYYCRCYYPQIDDSFTIPPLTECVVMSVATVACGAISTNHSDMCININFENIDNTACYSCSFQCRCTTSCGRAIVNTSLYNNNDDGTIYLDIVNCATKKTMCMINGNYGLWSNVALYCTSSGKCMCLYLCRGNSIIAECSSTSSTHVTLTDNQPVCTF